MLSLTLNLHMAPRGAAGPIHGITECCARPACCAGEEDARGCPITRCESTSPQLSRRRAQWRMRYHLSRSAGMHVKPGSWKWHKLPAIRRATRRRSTHTCGLSYTTS